MATPAPHPHDDAKSLMRIQLGEKRLDTHIDRAVEKLNGSIVAF
jgi:hypothetical protein